MGARKTAHPRYHSPRGEERFQDPRCREEGAVDRRGVSGDLYRSVVVEPDSLVGRHGDDLSCGVGQDVCTAVPGGQLQVPTLNRGVSLMIPGRTQGGQTFKLRDKGRRDPIDPGQCDNLLGAVQATVPTESGSQERDLSKRLAAHRGGR